MRRLTAAQVQTLERAATQDRAESEPRAAWFHKATLAYLERHNLVVLRPATPDGWPGGRVVDVTEAGHLARAS